MRAALDKAGSMLASIRDGCGPDGEKAAIAAALEVSLTDQAETQRADVLQLQERFRKAGASVTELQTNISALSGRSGVWPLVDMLAYFFFDFGTTFIYASFICLSSLSRHT